MVLDAVIRNFEIIGEAVKNIPPSVRARHPEVAWKEAAAFRDILIHNYFGINVEAVHDTIVNNLPDLKKGIARALRTEKAAERSKARNGRSAGP